MKYLNKSVVLSKEQHLTPRFRRGLLPLSILLISLIGTGCKKLVDVDPPVTSLTSPVVFSSDATAISAVTYMYTSIIVNNLNGGINSMSLFPALSADELTLYSGETNLTYIGYYTNELTNTNTSGHDYWLNYFYPAIFIANSNIAGLNTSSGLTPAIKQQLLGESEFMRAFYYFYLINLYGDVPLVLTTNYAVNALLARTPQAQVWQQIIEDLQNAKSNLSTNYLAASLLATTTARVRPTKWAAEALLARAYLYTGDWADAEAQSNSVINSTLYSLDTLNGVFLANSSEAIWQLQPTTNGENTPDAQTFIIPATGPSSTYPVYLSPYLLNSFEPGDRRRYGGHWVDSVKVVGTTYYFPFKYKSATYGLPVTEYEMVLRLGEQYLIRAEAEAELGDLTDAASDLNSIRNRAGLSATTATSQSAMIEAIIHERQVELFTEWGQRWLDLKRTKTVDAVMNVVTPQKGSEMNEVTTWNANQQWYPIELSELQADPNLTQNTGY